MVRGSQLPVQTQQEVPTVVSFSHSSMPAPVDQDGSPHEITLIWGGRLEGVKITSGHLHASLRTRARIQEIYRVTELCPRRITVSHVTYSTGILKTNRQAQRNTGNAISDFDKVCEWHLSNLIQFQLCAPLSYRKTIPFGFV